MEEFRALCVDRLVLKLIHARSVLPEQFTVRDGACEIGQEARRTLVAAFESWLSGAVQHPEAGAVDWRRVLDGQVLRWTRALRGQAPYQRFEVR
jgi:CRISPR/Cas system-associated endonuclease Cas1